MSEKISIIIPTLNEEATLPQTLDRLGGCGNCEVVVTDGGSIDDSIEIAGQRGCRVVSGPKGRARQMNLGAQKSSGDILLFLHADTLLPESFSGCVKDAVKRPGFAAGAFSLAIDSTNRSLAFVARLANLRSRLLQMPYGDQALFTTRKRFISQGGFPEMEIMEDFAFIRSMKRQGKVVTLPARVTTSARRWQNMGIVQTTLVNQLIVGGYWLGVPPGVLAGWYRRLRGVAANS